MNARFPGRIEALVESQTILVNYQPQSFVFYSFCHINYGKDGIPSPEVLIHEMDDGEYYTSSDTKRYALYPREMVAVRSLTCIVTKGRKEYYAPTTIPVMFNMVGEPTSLQIQSFNSTADSIRVSVATVIPSFVWCEAFSDPFYTPTVREVMHGKKYYSIYGIVAEVNGLVPRTEYRVFCYAESVAHVTMKERLADCSFTTKTKKAEYRFDSWNEKNEVLQFSIKTNIQFPFLCSIMRDKAIDPVNRIDNAYSISHEGPCLVKCYVSLGDNQVSMSRECAGVREVTVLSIVSDRTMKHPYAFFTLIAMGLVICITVFSWRRKSWRYTRLPNPSDV